jgi:phosphate-selective porin OprO/OprP
MDAPMRAFSSDSGTHLAVRALTALAALALSCLPAASIAADTPSTDALSCQLPVACTLSDGTAFGMNLSYQYDSDNFSHDDGVFTDANTFRRKQIGIYARKNGVFDFTMTYDFESHAWQDVYARVQSAALLKQDIGAFRLGFSKIPLGLENLTSSTATSFIEAALPTEAIQETRRIGIDWALQRPHFIVDAGYYFKGGPKPGYGYYFNGTPSTKGKTAAGRLVWIPLNEPGNILHFAASAAKETPAANVDIFGILKPAIEVIRTRPEADLTAVRLVNSGNILYADRIDRVGLEQLWISGPWSVQSEYLDARIQRPFGLSTYKASGYYIFGSWVLTGESRGYANGVVSDLHPQEKFGAVELLLRYSAVDLNDQPIPGGKEHDWTLGLNWYLNKYFKIQTNFIHADSERQGKSIDPNIFETRLQLTL